MKTAKTTLCATLLALAPLAAAADTILVPGQQLTIQAAIDAAKAGDVIVIAPGQYAGRLVIPADKDGIVLQGGASSLVTGGRPCTWKPGTDEALMFIAADDVTVRGLAFDGEGFAAHAVVVAGNGVKLIGLDMVNVDGSAILLLANGAKVQGCTVEAAAGAAVQLLPMDAEDPVCTWGGFDPKKWYAQALAGGPAAGTTVLAGNVFAGVEMGVRVTGLAASVLALDGNDAGAAPMVVVDAGAGSFQLVLRNQQHGAAYLIEDAAGQTITVHAVQPVVKLTIGQGAFGLGAEVATKYGYMHHATKPGPTPTLKLNAIPVEDALPVAELDLAEGASGLSGETASEYGYLHHFLSKTPAPTLKLNGSFFGDTPAAGADAGDFLGMAKPATAGKAAPGDQTFGLTGQTAN